MEVTDPLPPLCQAVWVLTGSAIPKKLLAAIVMLSLSGGATLPASATAAQPASIDRAHVSQPARPMQNHSCCPRVHTALAPPIALEFPPESIPCRERPCCITQGTDAPAGLPAASGARGPNLRETFREKTDLGLQLRLTNDTFSTALQPYFSSRMVLRIWGPTSPWCVPHP